MLLVLYKLTVQFTDLIERLSFRTDSDIHPN